MNLYIYCFKITYDLNDIMGREIAVLEETNKNPGIYSVNWDASTNTSGVYFVHFMSDGFTRTKKVVLMK